MSRSISKGKIVAIALGAVAVVLAGVIVSSMVVAIYALNGGPVNLPKDYHSKDASKELGTSENPYTILEIVPDTDSATVGYLIKGSEPISLERIGVNLQASNIYKEGFKSSSTVSEEPLDTYALRQETYRIDDQGYESGIFTSLLDEYEPGMPLDNDHMAFSQFGYFERVDNGGAYNYDINKECFVPAERDSSGIYNGNFNWIGVGSFQYKGIGKGNYSRELERYEVDEQGAIVVDEDGNPIENVRTYSCVFDFEGRVMFGAVGNKAYNYGYTTFGDFEWVPNDNYNGEDVTIENQTEVSYIDASGNVRKRTIEQAVAGDKFYMTRTENYFYKYKSSSIVCNDELIKAIANKTAIDYKTQVVTATPNQLKDNSSGNQDRVNELIDTADMIIIHDEVTGYNIAKEMKGLQGSAPTFTSNSSGSGDLSDDLVDKLITRGANGISKDTITGNITTKPAAIVFDESAIKNANNCTRLTRLYNVYNNLGAKLAYNLSGNNYQKKLDNYKNRELGTDVDNALGRSQFVYNYKGDNNSWLGSEFAIDTKISRNAMTESAFDNMDIPDNVNNMSVAKMLSAINKESQGYNQPEKLKILELEPNEKFYYNSSDRDSWLKHYLDIFPWFIGTTQSVGNGDGEDDDINITVMPTYEFIGKNEDINENYDAIFIGDKEKDLTNGSKGYNDSNYRSLDYVGIGDKVSTARSGEDSEVRYSGNDITKKKYYQLVEFAKQGPIIIDDKMYKLSNGQHVVDENIVDKSSFVYYIADKNKDDKYGNAVNSNNNSANSVKKDVTHNELSFTFIPNAAIGDKGYPIEYANTNGTMTDNSVQKEGINNLLKFRFKLNGKENTLYGLKLYIDDNGNGVYEGCIDHKIEIIDNGGDISKLKSEESSNLVIYDNTINMVVSSGNMVNGDEYYVTSVLPESTVGLISWKLELYAIDEKNPYSYPSIRCSAENDTRIVPKDKIKLNVLQMYTSPKMNEQDPTMSLSTDKNFIFGNRVAEEFSELVGSLPDFDIKVTYMSPSKWREQYGNDGKKWGEDLLRDYNMLILGFKDDARFTNNAAFIEGFEKFRQSGRPIILSHDMVSNDTGINDDVRYYIRNLTGQMRKYYNVSDVVNNNSNDYFFDRYWTRGNTEPVPFYYSKYKGGEGTKWAVSRVDNSNRVMLEYSDYKDLHDRFVKKPTYYFKWGILGGGYKDTRYVKPVNKGKITKYPFDLPKLEKTYGLYTRQTHAQNYQLDLEYDDEGDVIVWYNLVDGDYGNFYDGRKHDCRNNYYIYTKGNITYTGIGHSEGNWSEYAITTSENKLFINTMIAAYRSSAVDPYISIDNEDAVQESSDTYTIYMNDFDNYNAAGILDSNVRFSIKDDTTNADIRKRYWVEVFKDGQPFKAFPAEKNYTYGYGDEESEYGLPIRYSEVYSKDEVKYEIYLFSNYEGKTTDYNIPDDIKTVTIKKIPMFGLY